MAETTEPSGEALVFLQRRVRWFGLLAGTLVLGFYVYRILDEASLAALAEPSMLTHVGAGLSLLGMWLALRGPTRAARWVRLVEISGLVLASTLLVVMGMYIPLTAQPGRIVVMALAVVHMARAIYVPSSARRTALFLRDGAARRCHPRADRGQQRSVACGARRARAQASRRRAL
jgi:hypothetical protein